MLQSIITQEKDRELSLKTCQHMSTGSDSPAADSPVFPGTALLLSGSSCAFGPHPLDSRPEPLQGHIQSSTWKTQAWLLNTSTYVCLHSCHKYKTHHVISNVLHIQLGVWHTVQVRNTACKTRRDPWGQWNSHEVCVHGVPHVTWED